MQTNKLVVALGVMVIGTAMFSTSASAHCFRHIYNRSSIYWKFDMPKQVYPNVVHYTVEPGETMEFQIDTNTGYNDVVLSRGPYPDYKVFRLVAGSCYIQHSCSGQGPDKDRSQEWEEVVLNDPADGDIVLIDGPDPKSQRFTSKCH